MRMWCGDLIRVGALCAALGVTGCHCGGHGPVGDTGAGTDAGAGAGTDADTNADAGAGADTDAGAGTDAGMGTGADMGAEPPRAPRCPPEMVRVARRFCVDRYEAVLRDVRTGASISPFYPPSRRQAASIEKLWQKLRFEMGDERAQAMPLPTLPAWQREQDFEPRAVSTKGVVPQGYTSGDLAALACKNAGKRLCSLEEWQTACRGEAGLKFPYGPQYEAGRCNVFRESHPALVLHDDMTKGHSDPRLNQVKVNGKPLLRRTGETATCMSTWEGDAIADMVGNLDEWVINEAQQPAEEEAGPKASGAKRVRAVKGTFAGGFYSRSTREGCMAVVTSHTMDYFDYSTGIRCCADLPRE